MFHKIFQNVISQQQMSKGTDIKKIVLNVKHIFDKSMRDYNSTIIRMLFQFVHHQPINNYFSRRINNWQ